MVAFYYLVISIALSNKSPMFATGSGDHKARIWRMSKSKALDGPKTTHIAVEPQKVDKSD